MYDQHSINGIGQRHITFAKSGTITTSDIGKACTMNTSQQVAVGTADAAFFGVIQQVSGDDITVTDSGYVTVPYTGSAPTAGAFNNLECGAAGAVQIDNTNGREIFVYSVDTTASTCVVRL